MTAMPQESGQAFDSSHSSVSILPRKVAISVSVVAFAILSLPVLIVLQVLSSLYWGVTTIYSSLTGGQFDQDRELQSYNTRSWDT